MKRHLSQSVQCKSKRRGALFHYYLAYVTLTSSILVMAGTCLHTILQSDQTDRRVSLFLQSLLRCERMLRADADGAKWKIDSDAALTINRDDSVEIHWVADRGILTRQEQLDGKTLSSDRYIFPAGSKVGIGTRDDGATVLSFYEPSAFVRYSAAGNGGLNRNKSADEAHPPTPAAAAVQPVTEIVLYETP
jgi:hypothetical protein